MPARVHLHPRLARLAALLPLALFALGVETCEKAPDYGEAVPGSGAALFTSPQSNPVALSADGSVLYVANTTAGSVSVVDVSSPGAPVEIAEIKVGIDPVGIAVRPKASPDEDELVFVANHISDSISVISRQALDVVQTLQERDPVTGVSSTDEPVGIAFAGPDRAFVALDHPNQVLVLDLDANGRASIAPQRLALTAQAPRALTVSEGRLYVAAFESGNQTEFPSCSAADFRGLDAANADDEGCEFYLRLIDGLLNADFNDLQLINGVIVNFAAVSPNLGGRVIRDRDFPDRDLFVFDAETLAPIDVVEGVGTLLYGVARGQGGRVYVTHTEARNQLDGLEALDNRMFENRLAVLDCTAAGCGAPAAVDLEGAANPLAVPVPTPYGVAASGDGRTLVVSVAGSDGKPAGAPGSPAGQPAIPGLVTLDADGNVLGAVQTGAIPQGLALASNALGEASTAYVLNTVESTVSVVDVSTPASPVVLATLPVGSDPTPPLVQQGRIAFSTARASTSGNFSCESCHPNGNMDQLIWTINTVGGPDDGPDPSGEIAEPRTTMPIRGLRDTLPLHWDGTLGDPFGGPNGSLPDADLPPNCDIEDENSCFRHLVNASLRGVMCDQEGGCALGAATDGAGLALPGALDDADRDAMAVFLGSVSYPPSPKRRPDDVLSAQANLGVQDFFTDEDQLGVGSGAEAVGDAVNFLPITCADNSGGCHALPLTVATNSSTVGGFEAPTIRGNWDRWVIFSNGLFNSEEALELGQLCADGNPPPTNFLLNQPCTIDFGFNTGIPLRPSYPSGETVWDPAVGPTERGTWMASFEFIFDLAYGVPGENIWEFLNEMSVGLPGMFGRQLSLDASSVDDPDALLALARMEEAASEGRITAVARNRTYGDLRYQPSSGRWTDGQSSLSSEELRTLVRVMGVVFTVTAELPENVSIGGSDRQPLLDVEPQAKAAEQIGDLLAIPRVPADAPSASALGYAHVEPGATVFVDGQLCEQDDGCAMTLLPGGGFEGANLMILLLKPLSPGTHVVQVQNPGGWFSNEMPVFADAAL